METDSLLLMLIVQGAVVLIIAIAHRHLVSARLNLLVSSAFVTVPVWVYAPLEDVGIVYLFDIVVPVIFLILLYKRFVLVGKSVVILGVPIFLLLLAYFPIGYFFVGPDYAAYHTLILSGLLYRSLLIFIAVSIVASELRYADRLEFVRLMAFQFLALFAFGVMQYGLGIDLVVYERIKDTENVVDTLLSGQHKILFGFGFLGLFRGAVPQMAVIALFWWLFLSLHPRANVRERLLLDLMCAFAIICIAAVLSRIGVMALIFVLLYAALVDKGWRIRGFIYTVMVSILVLSQPDLRSSLVNGIELVSDRFSMEQLTGQAGSGSTRLVSAMALFHNSTENLWPWFVGVGGYNPIAANEYYGVFGMHGDYLDILARYGIFAGILYLLVIMAIFWRPLKGFFSRVPERRVLARSFGVLVIGIAILALTQGALTFSGTAGYLACAQTWMAVAFAIASRKIEKGRYV